MLDVPAVGLVNNTQSLLPSDFLPIEIFGSGTPNKVESSTVIEPAP